MLSTLPGSPTSSCAVSRANIVNEAPAGESEPWNEATPVTVTSTARPPTMTVARSPTEYPARFAVPRSSTTSPDPFGPRPSSRVNVLSAVSAQLVPTRGGPAPGTPTGSPSGSTTWAKPQTSPWTSATPGSCASRPTRASSIRGRCSTPVTSKVPSARTTASVLA